MMSDFLRKRISVVFVERVPWAGGAERVVVDIARNLDPKRFKPIIVCLYRGESPPAGIARGLSFTELIPDSLPSLLKATLKGRLGGEFSREWKRGLCDWWCRFKTALRLQSRVCNFKLALQAGVGIPFVKAKLCRLVGMSYSGGVFLRERLESCVARDDGKMSFGCRMLRLGFFLVYAWKHGKLRAFVSAKVARMRGKDVPPVIATHDWDLAFAERLSCVRGAAAPLVRLRSFVASNVPRLSVSGMVRACRVKMPNLVKKPEVRLSKPPVHLLDIPYRHRRPIDIERQARLLASFVASLRGPVVVVPVMEEAAAAVCLGLGARPCVAKPYIVQTHAWESYYLPVMYGGPGFDVDEERALFSNACRGAEVVTSPCAGCRDDLVENLGSPPETTVCLPNPVDIDMVKRLAAAEPEIPLPEICAGKSIFLCVARFDPQKKHELLFEACALLKERRDDFVLVCLGSGFYRPTLEKCIASLGLENHVILLGYTQNPFPYMRLAKAHVTASEWESFGLVIIEALACGCLPISTDCPHGPRDVLDGGKSGFLVPNGSAEKLAEAMHQTLVDENLVQEKLQYGQKYIERYSTASVIPQWEILFAHFAAKHSTLY